jgi:hypothetical protein
MHIRRIKITYASGDKVSANADLLGLGGGLDGCEFARGIDVLEDIGGIELCQLT